MPKGTRVEVEGITGLSRALRKAGDEGSRDFLLAANKEAARIVETAARPLVPQRTGRLLNSLRSTGTAKGGVVLAGKKLVPYARPVHFGYYRPGMRSGGVKGRPFLFEALDRRAGEVEEIYHGRLQELLDRVVEEANRGD